jgi:hypothetical protein
MRNERRGGIIVTKKKSSWTTRWRRRLTLWVGMVLAALFSMNAVPAWAGRGGRGRGNNNNSNRNRSDNRNRSGREERNRADTGRRARSDVRGGGVNRGGTRSRAGNRLRGGVKRGKDTRANRGLGSGAGDIDRARNRDIFQNRPDLWYWYSYNAVDASGNATGGQWGPPGVANEDQLNRMLDRAVETGAFENRDQARQSWQETWNKEQAGALGQKTTGDEAARRKR